jgi:hypothetical protein
VHGQHKDDELEGYVPSSSFRFESWQNSQGR